MNLKKSREAYIGGFGGRNDAINISKDKKEIIKIKRRNT